MEGAWFWKAPIVLLKTCDSSTQSIYLSFVVSRLLEATSAVHAIIQTTIFRDHRLNCTEQQFKKILQLPTIYNKRIHTKTDIDLITVEGQYLTSFI